MSRRFEGVWLLVMIFVVLAFIAVMMQRTERTSRDEWIDACVDEGSSDRATCEQRARGGYHG